MALTPEQRAELEANGPDLVRTKLLQGGADKGASIPGFNSGPFRALTRSDIEDWLVEKHAQDLRTQDSILRWAKIAGVAAIVGIIVGTLTLIVTIWPPK